MKKVPALLFVFFTAFFCEAQNDVMPPEPPGNPEKKISTDGIFEKVEIEAAFPGGENAWRKYLEQNLNPDIPVLNGAPAGTYTITIQFIVDTAGKLSALKAMTKHGYGMETEVMRILRKSPSWIPAFQFGRKVKAYRLQPVTFMVIEEKKKRKRGN